jgi:hypothetical protein
MAFNLKITSFRQVSLWSAPRFPTERLYMLKIHGTQRDDPNKICSDVLVAEYSALRDEILFRMRAADFAAFSATTVTVTVSGIALSYTAAFSAIILVAPYISMFAMYVYTSQLRAVKFIASYLDGSVRTDAVRVAKCPTVMGWEAYVIKSFRKSTWRSGKVDYPTAAFIVMAQIFALILGFQHRDNQFANTIIWWIGLLVTVWSALLWGRLEIDTRKIHDELVDDR